MRFRRFLLILLLSALAPLLQSFCGFYVAKADQKIWNKASSVILARQGDQSVVTMLSDFQGKVQDFAIVIPVPVVLKQEQIRIADAALFQKLDNYSAPRLVEYFDENPCQRPMSTESESIVLSSAPAGDAVRSRRPPMPKPEVKILERYTVGEYDILILSAEESQGLKTWLDANGYRMPPDAAEVLEPYLKSGMKFFVAKVNLEAYENQGFKELRPIQMTFRSDKFMLPIRLGMANASGDQDLLVYTLSDQGRVEASNYRTLEIPSDRQVPLFVKARFGEFYRDLFGKTWKEKGEDAVWVEYAWDISSSNYSHCDPCTGTPPAYADLREAGAFWLKPSRPNGYSISDYEGSVFFTRLHVRYRRSTFPQDLVFQATPNRRQFQGRYVLTHPAQGDLSCEEGKSYQKALFSRRQQELRNLRELAGWTHAGNYLYQSPLEEMGRRVQPYIEPLPPADSSDRGSLPPLADPVPSPPAAPPALPAPPQNRIFWLLAALGLALGAALHVLRRGGVGYKGMGA
jgi:hypothetical protein